MTTNQAFTLAFNTVAREVHENAKSKGWWDGPRNDGEWANERLLADVYAAAARIASPVPWPIPEVSPHWVGGLLDGEAHFGINKLTRRKNGRPQYMSRAQVGNTEISLLSPLLAFGGKISNVEAGRWNPNAAKCYKWNIHSRECQNFILAVLPYMRHPKKVKAAQALLSIEFLRRRNKGGKSFGNKIDPTREAQQEFYYQATRSLNARGPTLEALRKGNPPDDKIPEFSGLTAELADVVIRIMDYSEGRGLNVAEAIIAKMAMNRTRERMHGGKKF